MYAFKIYHFSSSSKTSNQSKLLEFLLNYLCIINYVKKIIIQTIQSNFSSFSY